MCTMSLPKLVRDHIPDIIKSSGKECKYFKVSSKDHHMALLKEKMIEELEEFLEDPCEEEAGDMLEVFLLMLKIKGISFDAVQNTSYAKMLERGSFSHGIVLESVH